MALAEDSSAPAALISIAGGPGAGGVTTANFNPPASSLVLIVVSSDAGSGVGTGGTCTVSDSIGNTFTAQVQFSGNSEGYSGIFTQYLVSAQTGYNVTIVFNSAAMQGGSSAGYVVDTYVLTGASATQNGATGSGGSTTSTAMSVSLTPTALGSYVYGCSNNWSSSTIPTALGNSTLKDSAQNTTLGDAWAIFRSTSTISSLTSQTFGFSDSNAHTVAAYEVLPVPNTSPIVSTYPVSSITPSTATGNGSVDDDGGNTITERGICWSTSPNPTTSGSKASTSGTTGTYSVNLTGLSDDTLYHVRAYAINSIGTSYGADVTFFNNGTTTSWLQA